MNPEKNGPHNATRSLCFNRILHPASFFVVLDSAIMQRGRQAILDHFRFFQIGKRRMQFLKVREVIEHRLGDGIDNLVIYIAAADEGRTHTKGLDVTIVVIHAGGNNRRSIIGIIVYQFVDCRSLDFDQVGITGRQ